MKKKLNESRIYLVNGELPCTNSSSIIYSALATMILQGLDKRRKPWPKKLLTWVLHQWKSILALKSRYTTLVYTQVQQTWYVYTTVLKLLLTSSRPIVRRRKNGSKIIIFRSQRTPWHTTMSTGQRSVKELSWFARLTYIIKNFGSRTMN